MKIIACRASELLACNESQADVVQEMCSNNHSNNNNQKSEVLESITKLAFFGNRNASLVCQSIIAASMKRIFAKNLFIEKHASLNDEKNVLINSDGAWEKSNLDHHVKHITYLLKVKQFQSMIMHFVLMQLNYLLQ